MPRPGPTRSWRALIQHFTERHPERLASLRATIQAGKLTVVRREPTWSRHLQPVVGSM